MEQPTPDDLSAFVEEAAIFAAQEGKGGALVEFGRKDGIFTRDDWYIYAYDNDGTLLAHPYEGDKVGTYRGDWADSRGLAVIRLGKETAANGGGFIAYLYPAPREGIIDEGAEETYVPKIGYVLSAGEGWWIGSGIYLSQLTGDGEAMYPEPLSEMIALVEEGARYARENGNDAARAEISDTSGIFVSDEGHYLYAYDYDGTLVAHPYLPEKIGTSLIDRQGPFGMGIIRTLAETAQEGGGFVVFIWPNPDQENRDELKIGYVLPVDDEWWIGSGVYLSEITGVPTVLPAR